MAFVDYCEVCHRLYWRKRRTGAPRCPACRDLFHVHAYRQRQRERVQAVAAMDVC